MTNHNSTVDLFNKQPQQDIYTVLAALNGHLGDLHKAGSELHSNCPCCGQHARDSQRWDKSDRFFTTSVTNYQYWSCRQCGHHTTTSALLGYGYKVIQKPLIKAWGIEPHNPQKIEWIRAAYADLAEYAQRHLNRAMPYLFEHGVTEEVAKSQGLGYLDRNLHLEWWRGLTPELRAGVKFGGLPDCDADGNPKGRGWGFAKGYQGKIVYPYHDHMGQIIDIRTRSISPNDKTRYMGPMGSYNDRQAHILYMPVGFNSGPVILSEGEFKSLIPLSYGCIYPVYSLRGTSDPIDKMLQYLGVFA